MSVTDAAVPVASDDELSDDIRLLGRLLGDVIRRQAGEPTFELVEKVRRTAVDARRSHTTAVDDLEALLGDQPITEQLHVIRAFDWLAVRGLQPPNYDPLGSREERRAALLAADIAP